jgi:hypothetical protein
MTLREVGERTAVLSLDGLPPGLATPRYLAAIGATLEAVLDVCGADGAATAELRPGGARFEVRWEPRRG